MALAAVHSKAVLNKLMFIHCLLLLQLLMVLCVWSLFCYAVFSLLCSFAIILLEKREMVHYLLLSSGCHIAVIIEYFLFITVPLVVSVVSDCGISWS